MAVREDVSPTQGRLHREGQGTTSEFLHPSLPPSHAVPGGPLPHHHSIMGQPWTVPFLKVGPPPPACPSLGLGGLSQKNGALEEAREYLTVAS